MFRNLGKKMTSHNFIHEIIKVGELLLPRSVYYFWKNFYSTGLRFNGNITLYPSVTAVNLLNK